MKSSNLKKLAIEKETIKTLTPDQLAGIAGGGGGAPTDLTH